MRLFHALRLNPTPCLAFVGSGGKTTALFQLARELVPPVIVTATAHMAVSQLSFADHHFSVETPAELAALAREIPAGVTLVTGVRDGERTKGVSFEVMEWLHALCQGRSLPLLIEADGSRQKPLKAPAEYEPPIPQFVEAVVVVAGLSALGKPLGEDSVHRLELYKKISGAADGQAITAEMVAQVLAHPAGGLKNIPPVARRIALLNQADTAELQAQGRSLAEKLLPAYEAVLVTSLQQKRVYAALEPVAGIVLAAGESSRFGKPKQLLDFHGEPFVRAITRTALAAGLAPVVVVTGANADLVEGALRDLPVRIVRNEAWREGQSTSIRAGLNALARPHPAPPLPSPWKGEAGAAVFLLADQPQVETTILRALIERHASDLAPIVAPLVRERRANPVLFDRVTFDDLVALSGDVGGRAIFSKFNVAYLPWHDERLLIDVDRPEDLEKLNGLV